MRPAASRLNLCVTFRPLPPRAPVQPWSGSAALSLSRLTAVREPVTRCLSEKALSRLTGERAQLFCFWLLFFFFFFFSKEPSSGLCLGHPATGTLRHPRTRPQVACSKYTQRVLHREGMGWPAEDGMHVSRAPWSADLRVTPATLLASVDVSPLQHSDPPSPVRQNPRALGGKGRPRHFIS